MKKENNSRRRFLNKAVSGAGVVSYLALNQKKGIPSVDSDGVRAELSKGGSIVI